MRADPLTIAASGATTPNTVPALVIRIPLEDAPAITVVCASRTEAARLADWIDASDALASAVEAAAAALQVQLP